jgi:hypothetical protein
MTCIRLSEGGRWKVMHQAGQAPGLILFIRAHSAPIARLSACSSGERDQAEAEWWDLGFTRCTCRRVLPLLARRPSSGLWPSRGLLPVTATMLPDEIVAQLNSEFQCREQQIAHLAALYTVCQTTLHATSTNNLRHISPDHHSSTSTASAQQVNRQS